MCVVKLIYVRERKRKRERERVRTSGPKGRQENGAGEGDCA